MGKQFHRNSLVFTMANEQGIALVIGMIIMILLVVLGGIMLYVTRTEIKVTSNYEQSVQALHAAEAGAEKVYTALKKGDTNGDGNVDGSDTVIADINDPNINDLDGNGVIDFKQVFVDFDPLPASGEIDVNSGDTFASVSVDASGAPDKVFISSTGKPVGTNAERTVFLTLTLSAQIGGALNNSVPDGSP